MQIYYLYHQIQLPSFFCLCLSPAYQIWAIGRIYHIIGATKSVYFTGYARYVNFFHMPDCYLITIYKYFSLIFQHFDNFLKIFQTVSLLNRLLFYRSQGIIFLQYQSDQILIQRFFYLLLFLFILMEQDPCLYILFIFMFYRFN
jgi:hypothetical protein